MFTKYKCTGTLTGHIKPRNVMSAQQYLTDDDMTQYLDDSIAGVVGHIEWRLDGDGHSWSVLAICSRDLTDDELRELGEWIGGQNSDGLGEGFEQQDFAWEDDESECGECFGCENGWDCEDERGRMISFDWEKNEHKFERI